MYNFLLLNTWQAPQNYHAFPQVYLNFFHKSVSENHKKNTEFATNINKPCFYDLNGILSKQVHNIYVLSNCTEMSKTACEQFKYENYVQPIMVYFFDILQLFFTAYKILKVSLSHMKIQNFARKKILRLPPEMWRAVSTIDLSFALSQLLVIL